MVLAHHFLKLHDQALQPTLLPDRLCHPLNPSKAMAATQLTSSSNSTIAKIALMELLEELVVIKQLVKATKVANMAATKVSQAIIMATTNSNAADGVATTEATKYSAIASRHVVVDCLSSPHGKVHQTCVTTTKLFPSLFNTCAIWTMGGKSRL